MYVLYTCCYNVYAYTKIIKVTALRCVVIYQNMRRSLKILYDPKCFSLSKVLSLPYKGIRPHKFFGPFHIITLLVLKIGEKSALEQAVDYPPWISF